MNNMNFVAVVGDDWQGIYLNGVLVTQNHSISAVALLRHMDGYAVGGRLDLEIREADPEWLYDRGDLPQTLDEVKFKVYA